MPDQNSLDPNMLKQFPITSEGIELAEKLLDSAHNAKVEELADEDVEYLVANNLPIGRFAILAGDIDSANDQEHFDQAVMILTDIINHIPVEHPEVVVFKKEGHKQTIKIVAVTEENLDEIPYDLAKNFFSEVKENLEKLKII